MLNTLQPLSKYAFKYTHPRSKVYIVAKPKIEHHNKTLAHKFLQSEFFTIPFKNNEAYMQNVIVAFSSVQECTRLCMDVRTKLNIDCDPMEFVLTDLSCYAAQIRMPLIVILEHSNSERMYEIFYTSKELF